MADKTKEIFINRQSKFGTIKFKYMCYTDSCENDVDYVEVTVYELRGYSNPTPLSGNFPMDKSRIYLSIEEEDYSYDNGNLAICIKGDPAQECILVTKEFIFDWNQYMFLLKDKFFENRIEAEKYFKNFVNKCYQSWLKQKKNKLCVE